MKTKIIRLFTLALFAGTVAPAGTAHAQANRIIHSISGSGLTIVEKDFFFPGSEPFSYRQSISAWQKADGTVGGNIVVQLWFPSRPAPVVLLADITCLSVEGNTGYSSGVLRWSSDLGFAKPGDLVLGFVTDTDGNGPDISWSGPAIFFLAPGQNCSARPFMPPVPIASGNFIVR